MKLRELINRLEELSDNGKNDNMSIIIEDREGDLFEEIERVGIRYFGDDDDPYDHYVSIELENYN